MANTQVDLLPSIDGVAVADGDNLYISDVSEAGLAGSKKIAVSQFLVKVKTYTDTLYSLLAHVHTFASITDKPTTRAGFGITDAASSAHFHTAANHVVTDAMLAAIAGVDCVLAGGAVTAQGSPNMTVVVAKASVLSNAILKGVAAEAALAIAAAHATLPRLDLVVATSAGAFAVRTGTAAETPAPPARTANDVVMAVISVPALDTTIAADQIHDVRVMRTVGPIVIHKITTPVVFNTTAAIQTYLTLTLPSGLFLAGKTLKARLGGNYLMNSGAPLLTPTISFGGTTLFADPSAAFTADTDRGAWYMEIELFAKGNAEQTMVGGFRYSPVGAKAPPTTGYGDISGHAEGPMRGTSAVDTNAADRTLTVQFTMSVSDAANEMVLDGATVELI